MLGSGAVGPGSLDTAPVHHLKSGEISGITAFKAGYPTFSHWWEWTLVTVIGVSVVIGTFAFVWYSYRSIRTFLSVSAAVDFVLPSVLTTVEQTRCTRHSALCRGAHTSALSNRTRSTQNAHHSVEASIFWSVSWSTQLPSHRRGSRYPLAMGSYSSRLLRAWSAGCC